MKQSAGRSRNDGQSKTVTTASLFVSLIKERTLAQAANLESNSGSGPHESAKKNRSIWILNPAADLTLIIGAPLLIFIGIMAAKGIWSSATITSFIMIWAIGHHLPGMMRAYGDPELFRRFWVRLILAPLFLLAVCIFAFWTTVNSGLIAIAAIWGWWHYLMQAYGFVRIYDSKAGSFAATTRWLDQGMCLTWFAAAVVLNDNALYEFIENFYNSGLGVPAPQTIATLQAVVKSATAAITTLFVINLVVRYRRGDQPSPVKVLLMVATFGAFWYSAATVTNIIVAYAFFELFHDVQYLTIVWAFNRNRVKKDQQLEGFTRFLFRPRVMLVGVYICLVFAYGSLNWATGLIDQQERYQLTRVLSAVFITSTLLHYYFDGFIWKLRESPTQTTLGIEKQKTRRFGFSVPTWLRHGMLWMLFIVPFGYLSVAQVLDAMDRQDDADHVKWNRRIQESQQLVACTPESVNAHFTLGLAYEAQELFEEAEREYQAALGIFPKHSMSIDGVERVQRRQTQQP